VLDIPVAEVMLDRPSVVTLVSEFEAARVAQHVRVNRESELGLVTGPGNDLPDRGGGHWTLAFGREDVRRSPVFAV